MARTNLTPWLALLASLSLLAAASPPSWRVPGLDERYPAQESVGAQASNLVASGASATSSFADFAALHMPLSGSTAHTAIHANVGFVSFNYTASLKATTVHMDEVRQDRARSPRCAGVRPTPPPLATYPRPAVRAVALRRARRRVDV